MDEETRQIIYEACLYDLCDSPVPGVALCDIANAVADMCHEDFGVTVQGWRSPDFCRMFYVVQYK